MRVSTLTVDLSAIVANWRLLCERHAAGNVSAVVKADAYGLGVGPVARALHAAGCNVFFVATLAEGVELREAYHASRFQEKENNVVIPAHTNETASRNRVSSVDEVTIYVFHGVGSGEEEAFLAHDLRPVLNAPEQIDRWQGKGPSALHIDTGMTRLGLSESELAAIEDKTALVRGCRIELLMSHLACASEPEHPLNETQRMRFETARQQFPHLACSLANSSGHFLTDSYHYDVGRPGCALYGITPNPARTNPMRQAVTLDAPILQIRDIDHDGTIGYGATAEVRKGMRVATVACGYADGVFRGLSNRLPAFLEAYKAPMLGRVSMDMTCYDVTDIPLALLEQTGSLQLIGPRQTVDQVAEMAGTIGYEVLTRLGNRIARHYIHAENR